MRSNDEILALWETRKKRLSPMHARACEVRDTTYSDIVLPLNEQDAAARPGVANTLLIGLEGQAERIASTSPSVTYAPVRAGYDLHDERARTASLVNQYWWEENRLPLLLMKRARYLQAYASSPVMLTVHTDYPIPCWKARNPLTTFPPEMEANDIVPDDCVFAYKQPAGWIRRRYPDQYVLLADGKRTSDDTPIQLVEYADAEVLVLLAVGTTEHGEYGGRVVPVQLERSPNLAGRSVVVIPGRISLEAPQGQFDGIPSLFAMQAKLAALNYYGMKKAVFPETWLVSTTPGVAPNVIVQADAMRGIFGELQDGRIETVRIEPSMLTGQHEDRLERAQRIESATPAEFSGESQSNVRTGRRGENIMANTIDFKIQQAHKLFEQSMSAENEIACAIDKAFFPTTKSFVMSSHKGKITYTPADTFASTKNWVKYAHAGADANGIVIAGGQRVGMGTMSAKTFMEIDPLIEDPDAEHDRIVYERIENAVLAATEAAAQSDPAAIEWLADMADVVLQDKQNAISAFASAQKKLREKQQAATEGQLAPAEMQPGVADPQAAIGPPPESLGNLGQLMQKLGQTSGVRTP